MFFARVEVYGDFFDISGADIIPGQGAGPEVKKQRGARLTFNVKVINLLPEKAYLGRGEKQTPAVYFFLIFMRNKIAMPVYEYECQSCKEVSEIWQNLSEAPVTSCPACSGPLKKIISRSSFHLKGGGWFADGYSDKPASKDAGSPAPSKPGDSSTPTSPGSNAPAAKSDNSPTPSKGGNNPAPAGPKTN